MMIHEIVLSVMGGAWAYGMPEDFRWDQARTLYENVVAGQVTFQGGFGATPESIEMRSLYGSSDDGGEYFFTSLDCEGGSIETVPAIYVSNPAPEEPIPVEQCVSERTAQANIDRALMKQDGPSEAFGLLVGREIWSSWLTSSPYAPYRRFISPSETVSKTVDGEVVTLNVSTSSLAALFDFAGAETANGYIDQAVDHILGGFPAACQAAYDAALPDWEQYQSSDAIEFGERSYYGFLFLGDGYTDCEFEQQIPGMEYQRYRIEDAKDSKVWDFTIRYVGMGEGNSPACAVVSEVRTTALVSDDLVMRCEKPVTSGSLEVDTEPSP